MEDTLIQYDTAVLAKEKGFLEMTTYHYMGSNEGVEHRDYIPHHYNQRGFEAAPTQSLLQKWLREVHEIIVVVHWNLEFHVDIYDLRNGLRGCHIFKSTFQIEGSPKVNYEDKTIGDCGTWEEALELGLQEALKLIK